MLALTLLLLGLAAMSPAIHTWLHDDAGKWGHECAITHFQRQQVLLSDTAVPLTLLIVSFTVLRLFADVVLLPQLDFRLPPGRAPPFADSSLTVVG